MREEMIEEREEKERRDTERRKLNCCSDEEIYRQR